MNGALSVATSRGGHGKLAVGGSVTLGPGSRSSVAIDSSGAYSQIVAGGAANVDGATFVVAAAEGRYSRVSFFPFLQAAGGVIGTATATTSIASLDPTLTARGQSLVLTLLNTALPLAPVATTASGTSVASAFDRLRPTATGDLVVIRELTALDDAALGRALDATAGEVHATATVLAAFDGEAVTNVVRQELATRSLSEIGTTARRQWPLGTRFWVRFHGQDTSLDSGSVHGADARLSGFVAGVDRTFASRWFAGAGAGYSTGDLTVDFRGDSADYTTPRGFGYVGVSGPRWIVHGGASVARNAYDLRRSLAFAAIFPDSLGGGPIFGGIDRQATMRVTGLATEAWGDAAVVGYLGQLELRPSAGLRVARYGRNGAAEFGADSLSLISPEQAIVSRQAMLGISASRSLGRFGVIASGGYQRELTDGRTTTTLQLSNAPAGLFTVDGASLARDGITADAGVTMRLKGVQLSLGYDAKHARSETRQGIQLGLRF